MNNTPNSLLELIEQVNISVKSGTLEKDYPDYLKKCRNIGVSSYVLNTLVCCAKKQDDSSVFIQPDKNFFVNVSAESKDKRANDDKINVVRIKTIRKIPWWFFVILIVLIVFTAGFAYDSFTQRKVMDCLAKEYDTEISALKGKLNIILSLSEHLEADIVLGNWKSDNNENNTVSQKSYRFQAEEGDILSFGYVVSSEKCCDSLSALLQCPNDSIVRLVKQAKGEVSSSCSYTFGQTGAYTLVFSYTKDYSVTKSLDCAMVNNIIIRRNTGLIVNNIREIASGDDSVEVAE